MPFNFVKLKFFEDPKSKGEKSRKLEKEKKTITKERNQKKE